MADSLGGGDECNVIYIEEAVRWQAVGQVIDVDDKQYRAYERALEDSTYGLSHLGYGSIDVHLKCSSNVETFDTVYYNGGNAVSSEFV